MNWQKEQKLSVEKRVCYEPRLLNDALRALSDKEALYNIHWHSVYERESDFSEYLYLFRQPDEKALKDAILSLTRRQIETFLSQLPAFLEVYSEEKIFPIIRYRYRKYMFRILYLFWQDYYDKAKAQRLFLYVLNHPKTSEYVGEVHFSAETLRSLALSNQPENLFLELARSEGLDMREFLEYHRINRDSVIAIDATGVFFLFCSGSDYLEFGAERMIIAIMRFEMRNQAKVLNNMVKKLTKERRVLLKDVFHYFVYKYDSPAARDRHEFWSLVRPETMETVQQEFGDHW